jgi:catechol 2,3-dioxygenase-like lactoylglutathione lyase family enzyme
MARLDHLALTVGDLPTTRDWYMSVLGLEVEFEAADAAGLKDEDDFTLILVEDGDPVSKCNLYFQVDDVEAAHAEMSGRGVVFSHPPQANDWGYGAGLADPDNRFIGLWDEGSMQQHTPD